MLVGVAKTCVPGLGIVVVPLMILPVGDARQSAAWLLPMLCTADVLAIIYWRRHAAAKELFSLAPVGSGGHGGWSRGACISGTRFAHIDRRCGARDAGGSLSADEESEGGTGALGALRAGGGLCNDDRERGGSGAMNLYLLSRRLGKEEFVATGAWFLFVIKLLKAPIYSWHGLFSTESLRFEAMMVPAVIVGASAGRRLVAWIPQRAFEALVLVLTGVSTLLMLA